MESPSQTETEGETPRKIYVLVYRDASGELKRSWFANRETALQAAASLKHDYEIQEATI